MTMGNKNRTNRARSVPRHMPSNSGAALQGYSTWCSSTRIQQTPANKHVGVPDCDARCLITMLRLRTRSASPPRPRSLHQLIALCQGIGSNPPLQNVDIDKEPGNPPF